MESFAVQNDLGVAMSSNPMPNSFDANKIIKMEQESLDITRFKGKLDDAEKRLLGKKNSRKKIAVAYDGGEPGYDIFGAGSNNKSGKSIKKNKKSKEKKSN